MDFDSRMKQAARGEEILTPVGYDEKIQGVLEALAPKAGKKRRRHKLSLAAAIVLVATLVCGTVLAVNIVLRMQGSEIGYFENAPEQDFQNQQEYWENTSDEVDMVVPDVSGGTPAPDTTAYGEAIPNEREDGKTEDITFTIDNIAMDCNYLNIFYTIETERTVRELVIEAVEEANPEEVEYYRDISDEYLVDSLGGAWFSTIEIDGQEAEILYSGGRGGRDYLEDDKTYVGTFSVAIEQELPDRFVLSLENQSIFWHEGMWKANFEIDLTEAKKQWKIARPNEVIAVQDPFGEDYTHEVVVERVSITENGGMVVLGEESQPVVNSDGDEVDLTPFVNFMVYDQNGDPLNRVTGSGGVYGGEGYSRNILEFAAGTDVTAVTLVPYTEDWEDTVEVPILFDEVGKVYGIYPGASVELVAVEYDTATEYGGEIDTSQSVVLKYVQKGVSVGSISKTRFLLADGSEAQTGSTMSSENPYVEPSTGVVTDWIAVEYSGDIHEFKGVIFEYVKTKVDEGNKCTVAF